MDTCSPLGVGEATAAPRHWSARLTLEFAHMDGRTRLARSEHEGPLRVQRLFHPETSGKAHCYLLHPPGGVVLGDELQISAQLHSGSALLTTPSAGRFYSVQGQAEQQQQSVFLSAHGGLLEWLPQETILFNGAKARLNTQIELQGDAELAYWDVLVLGRPASGERFCDGSVEQVLSIVQDQGVQLKERLALRAGDRVSRSPMGLNGASTLGIAVFNTAVEDELLRHWPQRAQEEDPAGAYALTQRGPFLIARYRGEDAQRCRRAFTRLWCHVGEARGRVAPEIPRIWHT